MAKKTKKSRKSRSTAASSSSVTPSKSVSNGKMVLRVRSTTENVNKSKSVAIEKQKRPKSANRNNQTKTAKIDAKMPKKPPTAFFYFLEDFRKEFQEQNPDVKSMRDVGKACGEKWKTMTYEEKIKYYDIATEKRAEFDRAMAEYDRMKENGEDEESDNDDSDFYG